MMNAVSRSSDTAALQGTAMLLSFATKSAPWLLFLMVSFRLAILGHP
jgi:hypothetical protein